MRLIFVRHGQTTGDVENRYGGDYDDDLTATGRTQAEALAAALMPYHPKGIVTSPLRRAMQTASIVGSHLALAPEIMHGLKECNRYGVLTGLVADDAAVRYPEEVAKLKDYRQTVEGAEEYRLFGRRLISVMYKLLKRRDEPLVIVTHGGVIRFLYRELLQKGEVSVDDCAYAVIEAEGRSLKVVESHGIKPIVRS